MSHSIGLKSLGVTLAIALLLVAPPVSAAHHEPVVQSVAVNVAPGKLDEYRGKVKQLVGVLKRVGSAAKLRMWQATVGGPETGTVIVVIEYPTAAAWAADSAKIQADPEWMKIIASLDPLRTVTSNSVWRDVSVTPVAAPAPGSGGILAITGVRVTPGKLDTYRKRVDSSRSITKRLGLNGNVRVWHADLAGSNTGQVAIGVEYPDLASYTADQGKLAGDAEWKKFLAGFTDLRTLTGRWVYQEITP